MANAGPNVLEHRHRVSPLLLGLTAVLILGAALVVSIITVLSPSSGNDSELPAYDRQAIAILDQQSAINGEWNSLLDDLSVPIAATDDEYVVQFNARLAKARSIVNDSQAIIVRWRKLEPPAESSGSHGLALEAMESTQYGFIAMQEYLEQAASLGISDASLIEESQSHIDDASKLWEQARQADVGS